MCRVRYVGKTERIVIFSGTCHQSVKEYLVVVLVVQLADNLSVLRGKSHDDFSLDMQLSSLDH